MAELKRVSLKKVELKKVDLRRTTKKKVFVPNDGKEQNSKWPTFEERLEAGIKLINELNLKGLIEYRGKLIKELADVTKQLKDPEIKSAENRRKFLVGMRRMVVGPLIGQTNKRITQINRVIHNGTTKPQSKRFIEIAATVLPIAVFQKIYGMSLTEQEKEEMTIQDIRNFLTEHEKNGNIITEGRQ